MLSTLEQLVEVRSLWVEELLAYLDTLEKDVNSVPPYYPQDARFERVRVRVRVSSERQKFDPVRAAERERVRRAGLADEETLDRAYTHRFTADERTEVKVLDWDR